MNRPENKYVCVEYGYNIQNCLSKELKKLGIDLVFKAKNRTANLLKTKTDINTNKFEKSGVFQINCPDCSKTYIEQTSRSFSTHYFEHKPDPRHDWQNFSFAQHIIYADNGMSDIDQGLKVLHFLDKRSTLKCA